MSENLQLVPVSLIDINAVKLRDVDVNSEKFMELEDSVRANGVLQTITIRPVEGGRFNLIDGLQRLTAAKRVGLENIKASIVEMDDYDALKTQMVANYHRIETKPVEFGRQLLSMLALRPSLTEAELARETGFSVAYIRQRLDIVKKITNERILNAIESGDLSLINAHALASLPEEEQVLFVDDAMLKNSGEFGQQVASRVKELREAARQGRDPAPKGFAPVARVKKLSDLREVINDINVASQYASICQTKEEAWQAGVAYAISLDAASIEEQKRIYDEKEVAKATAAEERARKREEAKAAKAAAAAEEAAAHLT